METFVEITLALDPDAAAKLLDLAGGEANVKEYAATIIQNLSTEEQAPSADVYVEQALADAQSLIDMSG
jgi:hypothetical protein